MRIACLLLLVLLSPASWAMKTNGEIEDVSELAALPAYCKGTQTTREVAHDPRPISEYVAIYGPSFMHLHHYCWALNAENHLNQWDEYNKTFQLGVILSNIKYVLDNSPLTFSLIPEIYNTKARILFKLHRDADAVDVLFKLTQIKPDYARAYAQLGDYYQHIGDKSSAIRYYEQGLLNTKQGNAEFFIWKIKKLDNNYKIPLVNTPPKVDTTVQDNTSAQALEKNNQSTSDNPPDPNQTSATPESNPTSEGAAQHPPADQTAKDNPYCRFCP